MSEDKKTIQKQSLGWLTGKVFHRKEAEEVSTPQVAFEPIAEEEHEQNTPEPPEEGQQTSAKEFIQGLPNDKDKVTVDLLSAAENIIKDRQLKKYAIDDLKENLANANELAEVLKRDLQKEERNVADKEEHIHSLEEKLSQKKVSYDQLLEDYQDFQSQSSSEMEDLQFQVGKEQEKYHKLNEEYNQFRLDSLEKAKELEEVIREKEAENKKLVERYQKIRQEKEALVQAMNDFTERMTTSIVSSTADRSDKAPNVAPVSKK